MKTKKLFFSDTFSYFFGLISYLLTYYIAVFDIPILVISL